MTLPFSLTDQLITTFDAALRSLVAPQQRATERSNPAHRFTESTMTNEERRHVSGLMRVNHSGEVCAQALYQGQALTAKSSVVREQMSMAAKEEVDHLGWCEARLNELNSTTAVFNPIWYGYSLMLGLIAGAIGDKWSLGFVVETERQVSAHLQEHIERLPNHDEKSRAILVQMQQDEQHHADMAIEAGATELPYIVKQGMRFISKLMTKTSYYF